MTDLTRVLASAEDRSRVERAQRISDWIVYGAGRTGRPGEESRPEAVGQPVVRSAPIEIRVNPALGLHRDSADEK